MDTSLHDLSGLLAQLGLSGERQAVEIFLATHHLEAGVALKDAPFWNPEQAAFLEEAFAQDADWVGAADALATRLSAKHY